MKLSHYLLRTFVFIIIFYFCSLSAISQDLWRTVNGPFTATIRDIEFNSQGHIFAGPFRSTDGGINWTLVYDDYVAPIAIDSNDRIFIGTNDRGVIRSLDNGDTWTGFRPYIPSTTALAIDSVDNIYAGTIFGGVYKSTDNGISWVYIGPDQINIYSLAIDSVGSVYAGSGGHVYRTTDNGETWEDLFDFYGDVTAIILPFPGNIFAASDAHPYTTGSIYRSWDNGATWHLKLDGYNFLSLAIDDQMKLYAGTISNGIFCSETNGNSWPQQLLEFCDIKCINTRDGGDVLIGTGANGIQYSETYGTEWTNIGPIRPNLTSIFSSPDGNIYAGSNPEGLYKSSDGGENWTITRLKYLHFYESSINPQGHLYIACRYNGVYRSFDAGANWHQIAPHPMIREQIRGVGINYNGDIYLGTHEYETWRSTDNAGSWIMQEIDNVNKFVCNPNGYTFADSDDGFYRSPENSNLWEQVSRPPWLSNSLISKSNGELFASSRSNGVYYSIDNSDNWIHRGLENKRVLSIAMNDNGLMAAGTLDDGIYVSNNEGINWTKVNLDLMSNEMPSVALTNEGDILINNLTEDDGSYVLKSNFRLTNLIDIWPGDLDNNGIVEAADIIPLINHWSEILPARENIDITWSAKPVFELDSPFPLYADANGNGNIDMIDFHPICINWGKTHGETISPFNNIDNLDLPANREILDQIYDQVRNAQSGPQHEIKLFIENLLYGSIPAEYEVYQNYPNPFNASTSIKYEVPEKSEIVITIYNVLGQHVRKLISDYHDVGKYEIEWNGDDDDDNPVSSGIYYYRFESAHHCETISMILLK
ncbi:MAG: T9SS type A sorting domain-containing protein [candidate division Zixibacteria bacterium]|nr:T9SS type A sorting domain-containing protein [candidate division Zixibacteria bacterium]